MSAVPPPTVAPPASPASEGPTAPLTQTQSAPAGQQSSGSPMPTAKADGPSTALGTPVPPSMSSSAPQPSIPAVPTASQAQPIQVPEKHTEQSPQASAAPSTATDKVIAVTEQTRAAAAATTDKLATVAQAVAATVSGQSAIKPEAEHITPAPPYSVDHATTPVLKVASSQSPERSRTPSPSGSQRIDTAADLASHSRSRRNSASDAGHDKADKPTGLVLSHRPGLSQTPSSSDLKSGLASPLIPAGAVEHLIATVHKERPSSPGPLTVIVLWAGPPRKSFEVHKHHLTTEVPHFARLFAHGHTPSAEELTFPDLDEYGFALFVRWLYGGKLHGPSDFHSFQHYLSLYVLAHRFHIESLCNNVIDLCRSYYRTHSMTAPAYRIEYIYSYTSTPNHMRNFLLTTAAYRCLCDAPIAPGVHLSDSMKALLVKGGDLAVDFPEALIKLSKNGIVDVRRGSNCTFHEHSDGKYCEAAALEPYMNE